MMQYQYCACGTKNLAVTPQLLAPHCWEPRIQYNEGHESHMAKAVTQDKKIT